MTLVDGDPGVGKSTLLHKVASDVSLGEPLPGDPRAGAVSELVLLLCGEEHIPNTVAPRIRGLGGDPKLAEVREERKMTQEQVASKLAVPQTRISAIEHEDDLYLSTLTGYVEALGGHLEVSAVFPEERVSLLGPTHLGANEAEDTRGQHDISWPEGPAP